MGIEEGRMAIDDAQALPDAVAEHETGIENRDGGFLAALHGTVDVDQDVAIARIVGVIVAAMAHARASSLGAWRAYAMRPSAFTRIAA